MTLAKESGRISALRLERYIEENRKLETVFLPQFELIEYEPNTGNTVNSRFVTIHDDTNSSKSGSVECNTELEALQYALEYRDNLNF